MNDCAIVNYTTITTIPLTEFATQEATLPPPDPGTVPVGSDGGSAPLVHPLLGQLQHLGAVGRVPHLDLLHHHPGRDPVGEVLSGNVTAVTADVTAVTAVTTDVTAVTADVTAVTADVTAVTTDVTAVTTGVTAVTTDVTAVTTDAG